MVNKRAFCVSAKTVFIRKPVDSFAVRPLSCFRILPQSSDFVRCQLPPGGSLMVASLVAIRNRQHKRGQAAAQTEAPSGREPVAPQDDNRGSPRELLQTTVHKAFTLNNFNTTYPHLSPKTKQQAARSAQPAVMILFSAYCSDAKYASASAASWLICARSASLSSKRCSGRWKRRKLSRTRWPYRSI